MNESQLHRLQILPKWRSSPHMRQQQVYQQLEVLHCHLWTISGTQRHRILDIRNTSINTDWHMITSVICETKTHPRHARLLPDNQGNQWGMLPCKPHKQKVAPHCKVWHGQPAHIPYQNGQILFRSSNWQERRFTKKVGPVEKVLC